MSAPYEVRKVGDPVLRKRAIDVTDVDGKLVKLADDMLETMYAEPGIGLAAPQVGVSKRLFVYDIGEGPQVVVNPVIEEFGDEEWAFDEGCLSVPGLSWEIIRPKTVHLVGIDLDGNEVSIEADELLSRAFQHEMDHLDGILLLERLEPDQKPDAMKLVRETFLAPTNEPEPTSRLGLPGKLGKLTLP